MRKERTKQEMEDFRKAKEVFKEQQRIEMEVENQRIMKYCLEREAKLLEESKLREKQHKDREALNERMVATLDQMIVSHLIYLKSLDTICKSCQKCMNMSSIWQTLSKAFQHQGMSNHRLLIIRLRNLSVTIQIHHIQNNIDKILNRLLYFFLLVSEKHLPQQIHHLIASQLAFALGVIHRKTIIDLFVQSPTQENVHHLNP